MAVYVDDAVWPWRGQMWCHLLADDLEELHVFAARIGMRRTWFQCPPKASRPHYDLNTSRRAVAVRLGAIEVDRRQTRELARELHRQWLAQRTPPGTQPCLFDAPGGS